MYRSRYICTWERYDEVKWGLLVDPAKPCRPPTSTSPHLPLNERDVQDDLNKKWGSEKHYVKHGDSVRHATPTSTAMITRTSTGAYNSLDEQRTNPPQCQI